MGYRREAMDRWGMGGRPWIGGVWEGEEAMDKVEYGREPSI